MVYESGAIWVFFFPLYLLTLLWSYVAVVHKMILRRSSFSAGFFFLISILFHYFITFSFWKKVFSLVLISLIHLKPFLICVILLFTLLSKITAWSTVSQLPFRIFRTFLSCIKMFLFSCANVYIFLPFLFIWLLCCMWEIINAEQNDWLASSFLSSFFCDAHSFILN